MDEAFKRLEDVYDQREPALSTMFRSYPFAKGHINDPNWVAFRNDPRFWEFVERLNLPPLPYDHPGYAEEQEWKINKRAEELIAERGLVPQNQN